MKRLSILQTCLFIGLLTVSHPAWAETVNLGGHEFTIETDSEGSYYKVASTADLDALANYVNVGYDTSGKRFKMTQDITYSHETNWNSNSSTENNYTPIAIDTEGSGGGFRYFRGCFDGAGHKISGIRIYKRTYIVDPEHFTELHDIALGLFGSIGEGAIVKGVTLTDTRISGRSMIAGIVARNVNGTVEDCHVTNTVALRAVSTGSSISYYGGIVANNTYLTTPAVLPVVRNCSSAVTISVSDDVKSEGQGRTEAGGICGENDGTLCDNYVIGAAISDFTQVGCIVGYNIKSDSKGVLENNYYYGCTIDGSSNVTNRGTKDGDVTSKDGARSAHKLTLGSGITASPIAFADNDNQYCADGKTITLSPWEGYDITYVLGEEALAGNTFTMPTTDATVSTEAAPSVADWAEKSTGDDWANAYIIYIKEQLDLLATRVNAGANYQGKYFKLGADIKYSYEGLSSTESNYTPIGRGTYFKGHFDGGNHTISGIRIYKGGSSTEDMDLGIFANIANPAEVKNIVLEDAMVTGYYAFGGIVGYCVSNATITNCHVASDVTIQSVREGAKAFGGVVGVLNEGTVSYCSSGATLTVISGNKYYGAIVGDNSKATITHNIAIGAVVPAAGNNYYGTILGFNSTGTLSNNYYTGCTVAGVENATGVGCQNSDITDNDGAVPALRDAADNTTSIGLLADVPACVATSCDIKLNGRTLYKDGKWNTLCLPFDVTLAGSPLAGAEARRLSSASFADGTLTLNFTDPVDELVAGTPYIIKWATADDIVSPVFSNVTVSDTNNDFSGTNVSFKGTYQSRTFAEDNPNILFMGGGNTLYWPKSGASMNACRAYFEVTGSTPAREFVFNFGDGIPTAISRTEITDRNATLSKREITEKPNAWYDLQGRKVTNPTKGLYIVNGRKVVIK